MNFLLENILYFWLIIAFFFLILEMGSPGLFFFLSFFVGALCAAGTSLLFSSLIIQCGAFVFGTIIALVVLKQWVAQKMFKGHPRTQTNVFALQGKHGMVLKDITPQGPGEVKINSEVWTARSAHDEVIKTGETVEVVTVRGAHVVVKKLNL